MLERVQPELFVGIDSAMTNEAYHAHPAIGSSGIRRFLECPALYEHDYILCSDDRAETAAQNFGSAAHCWILEPSIFSERYMVAPEAAIDRRTAAWKETLRTAEQKNLIPLLAKDFERINAMREAVLRHPIAQGIINMSGGNFELSAFAVDEETGLHLKARPDRIVDNIIIDYKTTEISLGLTAQERHAYSLGRSVQAYHHKYVLEKATCAVVDKVLYLVQMAEPPHLIRVFNATPTFIDFGRREVERGLFSMAKCMASGIWPAYPIEITDLNLPAWAGNEIN